MGAEPIRLTAYHVKRGDPGDSGGALAVSRSDLENHDRGHDDGMDQNENDHPHPEIGRGVGVARVARGTEKLFAVAEHVDSRRQQQNQYDSEEHFELRSAFRHCSNDVHENDSSPDPSAALMVLCWKTEL